MNMPCNLKQKVSSFAQLKESFYFAWHVSRLAWLTTLLPALLPALLTVLLCVFTKGKFKVSRRLFVIPLVLMISACSENEVVQDTSDKSQESLVQSEEIASQNKEKSRKDSESMKAKVGNETAMKSRFDGYQHSFNSGVVKAINVGGAAYIGHDGIHYEADDGLLSGERVNISGIKGSQQATLFETLRRGDIDFSLSLDNGEYDITFKFAEPDDIDVGERVFDVLAQNRLVIDSLDVRLARDGNIKSDVVRTVQGIQVRDEKLDISFKAKQSEPILNAIIIRKKTKSQTELLALEGELAERWELVWQDEFDYDGKPDPTKWSFDVWPAGKVNAEDQAYTDRPKNARVKDGKLIIEAHKEDYGNAKYTSARLHTLGKADFLYGRFDVRARVPAGQGTWAAAWMLPSDPFKYALNCKAGEDWQGSRTCDAWPNSGEIDILEHVGYDMQRVHGTVHTKSYYWINGEQRKASFEGQNVEETFHLYSLEWSPNEIVILFDNVPYFFYRNEQTDWKAWPFDQPFHMILNLAIGGAWGRAGGPIDDSIFPVQMEVDYVRVYKPK